MVGQTAAVGLGLTAAVGLAAAGVGGRDVVMAAAGFGALATVLQTAAVALARRSLEAGDYRGLLTRWGAGAGLRLAGVVAIPVAVTIDRTMFPPLAAALGYVAVLVPLFFLEIRKFR